MSKDYGSWSVTDLKNELRKRQAKVGGKKAVLVQRLEDYDKLFGPLMTEPEAVFKISVPAPQHFQDVTSDSLIPTVTAEDMNTFSQLTGRENIDTSHNMYIQNFLKSCRVAVTGSEYYITGMVSSEMRKNITYNVTIKARNHIILEAQCECAAGLGPYAQCKHILVLIFGLIDMNKTKTMKLLPSSTSNLQVFHHPSRLHTGDPVKAADIKLKFKDTKYKEISFFDPRPSAESAEKYKKYFEQAVANFCGRGNQMSIAQIVKPADKACIDSEHDYLPKSNADKFLDSLSLTENAREKLEEKTRTNKKLWKEERLMRIPSSKFGIICTTQGSKKNIVRSLLKNEELATVSIKHGIKYEEEAIREFEKQTNFKTMKCGIVVHKDIPFLSSTPDRLVEENGVLEVKCPYTARNELVSPETVPYLYLCEETGTLKLFEEHFYYYQVQGQMMCTERSVAYFCVYTFKDFKIIMIEKNDTFIESMVTKLVDFYNEYFKIGIIEKFLYNKK